MADLSSSSISRRCRCILLGILVIACNNFFTASAWSNTAPITHSQRYHNKYSHRSHNKRWSTTQLSYRDDEHESIESKKSSTPSPPANDFQSRMKRMALQRNRSSSSSSTSRRSTGKAWRPSNVKTAISLEEFAGIIQEGRAKNQLVVVRFYATWCKKCHAIRPSFDKVASSKPHIIFVDVPVTNTNVELHQGLGVKSVPFAHIYCPEKGLVVEEKISRSRFSEFEELVGKYSS